MGGESPQRVASLGILGDFHTRQISVSYLVSGVLIHSLLYLDDALLLGHLAFDLFIIKSQYFRQALRYLLDILIFLGVGLPGSHARRPHPYGVACDADCQFVTVSIIYNASVSLYRRISRLLLHCLLRVLAALHYLYPSQPQAKQKQTYKDYDDNDYQIFLAAV